MIITVIPVITFLINWKPIKSSKGLTWADLSAFPPGPKLKKRGGCKVAPPQKWGARAPGKVGIIERLSAAIL